MVLSSEKGKRWLNRAYSIGASFVVLGAMFKILHLGPADIVLGGSLVFEALVFFISAFERPSTEYNWEEVFPVLKSKNPLDRPDFAGGNGVVGGNVSEGAGPVVGNFEGSPVVSGGGGYAGGGGPVYVGGGVVPSFAVGSGNVSDGTGQTEGSPVAGGGGYVGGGTIYVGGGSGYAGGGVSAEESASIGLAAMGLNVSEEDAKNLSNSIQKLSEAAEQISKMADLTDATQLYAEQIATVSQNLERFNIVTNSLSEVSDTLVNSCKAISGADIEGSGDKTLGYVQQMEQLNEKLSGLNEFYDVHLSGLRSQMDTIHHINTGLNRIREMYDNSVLDSTAFRNENERMAQLLNQLNQVYGRLLQAMTVNMPGGAGMYPPQQSPYQSGYPQQPPYPNQMR